jgi:hypothetical protein
MMNIETLSRAYAGGNAKAGEALAAALVRGTVGKGAPGYDQASSEVERTAGNLDKPDENKINAATGRAPDVAGKARAATLHNAQNIEDGGKAAQAPISPEERARLEEEAKARQNQAAEDHKGVVNSAINANEPSAVQTAGKKKESDAIAATSMQNLAGQAFKAVANDDLTRDLVAALGVEAVANAAAILSGKLPSEPAQRGPGGNITHKGRPEESRARRFISKMAEKIRNGKGGAALAEKFERWAAKAGARHIAGSGAAAVAGPGAVLSEPAVNAALAAYDVAALAPLAADGMGLLKDAWNESGSGGGHAEKKSNLNLSAEESRILDGVSAKSGVPREYLEHALQLENSGEHAVSPKGAMGRFQIMKGNLHQGEDPTNFGDGANAAARVLHDAISLYGHDERAVMAYYNGGREQGDLVHSGANPSNKETRNYVSRLDKLNGKNA